MTFQPSLIQKAINIELRDYQKQMVGETYGHIKEGRRRILWVAGTGLGKTIIASWVMRDAVTKGKRCVFLCPFTVLIDQTIEALELLGVHCTGLQGSRRVDTEAPVIVASLQTITARVKGDRTFEDVLGHQDVVLADEAHISAYHSRYPALQDWVLGSGGLCLGMTATPWRLSRKQWLGQRFDCTVEGPQPPDAVKLGAIVPCRGFNIGNVFDIDKLRTVKGDFSEGDMSKQATRPEALQHVVNEWKRIASDRATMMVGSTVAQAKATAEVFEAAGVKTALIIGSTEMRDRHVIFNKVKSGEVQVICSVGCLTAGFNLPCIGAVLFVRATKSRALFFQVAGRACRTDKGKHDFMLLDFGGNLKRFGNPIGYQVYDISEKKQDDMGAPTKTCPECGAEVFNFASICPECGYEFPGVEEEEGDFKLEQLTEYVDKSTKDKIKFIRQGRKAAFKEKRSPDEPIEAFVEKFGHQPALQWMDRACLTRRKPSQARIDSFQDWLGLSYAGQPQWKDNWMNYHVELEFGTRDLFSVVGKHWTEVLALPQSANWAEVKAAYQSMIQYEQDASIANELNDAIAEAKDESNILEEAIA